MFKLVLAGFSVGLCAAADPIITVGLSAGSGTGATLSKEVSTLQGREHSAEAAGLSGIQAAYNAALANAKAQISTIIGGHSFLKDNSVLVKVLSGPGIAQSNLAKLNQLENARGGYEGSEMAQATKEFDAITQVVLGELKSAMHGSSFLKTDVRVQAGTVPFPTVIGMLKRMEFGRDASEAGLRGKVLDMQQHYVQDLNRMIQAALKHSSFLAQQSSPILSGLEGRMASAFPGESASSIRAMLSDALLTAVEIEDIPAAFVTCMRNVSGCPSGWSSQGSSCNPPSGYTGNCEGPVDFSGLSPALKANLADSCQASFPCM